MHSIPQAFRHTGKPLRLNEMKERERREHCAVAVNIRLDHEGGATNTVEIDNAVWARVPCIGHVGHKAAVCRELGISLEQNIVGAQCIAESLGRRRIDPGIEIVRADFLPLIVVVVVPLEAIGYDDRAIVGG